MSAPGAVYDTSVVIDFEKVDLGEYLDGPALVSAITVGELAYGLFGTDQEVRATRFRRVLRDFEVLPYGVEEGKLYGVLAGLVRSSGRDPRPRRLDLQIAATAAAARLPLLTLNPRDLAGLDVMVDIVPMRRSP